MSDFPMTEEEASLAVGRTYGDFLAGDPDGTAVQRYEEATRVLKRIYGIGEVPDVR
jgi:hypothetical protein